MTGATNYEAKSSERALEAQPATHEDFDLLPWADPYIAMLVNRYVAEANPGRPRKAIRSVEVVVPEQGYGSMLDRFAI